MASDLKKFVNSKFLRTVPLPLLRQLFARQPERLRGFDLAVFDRPAAEAREALAALFAGPEDDMPQGVVADLHRIAELGTEHGMNQILARAEARGLRIDPMLDADGQPIPLDPKQFAILAFLQQPQVFDAVSDMMAREARSSLAEYVGEDEGVALDLTDETRRAFEEAAQAMFARDHRSAYCRVGWYDDGPLTVLVVTHGAPVSVVPVINGDQEDVISYRSVDQAILSYHPGTGRLGVAGLTKARRGELAEMFAQHLLDRPGFFAGEDCQDLYSLAAVERAGLGFKIDHAFDPDIVRVEIVEVQLDRLGAPERAGDPPPVEASFAVRCFRGMALGRVGEFSGDRAVFAPGRHRLGHLTLRVHFNTGGRRPAKVTVKIKPPSHAIFKRHRFEARVMELLRRNGFCRDRQPAEVAAAAE